MYKTSHIYIYIPFLAKTLSVDVIVVCFLFCADGGAQFCSNVCVCLQAVKMQHAMGIHFQTHTQAHTQSLFLYFHFQTQTQTHTQSLLGDFVFQTHTHTHTQSLFWDFQTQTQGVVRVRRYLCKTYLCQPYLQRESKTAYMYLYCVAKTGTRDP